VVLAASIDTDGHIAQLRTISSPDASLAAAAIDAVRRWAYKPYLLNGEVVAVDTQINVDFKLHR
jgi:protein TonB